MSGSFKHIWLLVFSCCFIATTSFSQFYTGSHQEFGKNRVQYKDFLWQYYAFDKYETYFYEGGKELAIYTSKSAKQNIAEIERLFDYAMEDKIEFIVYNTQSDFRQSNIGLTGDEQFNIGGTTRIVGSKVFLYFEGDHKKLDEQIRAGVTEVLINQMMYGGNWKDVIKNSTLLSLPDWYIEGLVSYAAKDWSVEIDNRVRDGIISGRYDKFNRLSGVDATYAGHSIWNYIAEVYGENVIPNILYMTRISRNVESGFLFVLGVSLKTLSYEYLEYYKKKFQADEKIRNWPVQDSLAIKTKKTRVYSQFKMSPDGRYGAYVTNELGQYKVWMYDVNKKKAKKIIKGEHKLDRITDHSYPILAWHPTGQALTYITEKKGMLFLNIYTLSTNKTTVRQLFQLEKVLDMAYSSDGKKMVFSAVKKGQSDIYLYNVIGNRQEQLTNDVYDDLHPRFAKKSKEIIFASNREDDTLRAEVDIKRYASNKDIYVYNLETRSQVLTRITNTPYIDEVHPMQYDSAQYVFLSNKNGIVNRYVAHYDSTISHIDTTFHYRYFTITNPVTNYSRNILEYEMNLKKGKYSQLLYKDGKYHFYIGKIADDRMFSSTDLENTNYIENKLFELGDGGAIDSSKFSSVTAVETNEGTTDENTIDINNYTFDGEEPEYEKQVVEFEEDTTQITAPSQPTFLEDSLFVLPQQSVYKINFATDYVVTQVDNSFLNASYQRYTGPGTVFNNPGFNFLSKLGASDLFEDYKIVGGFRLSGDFNSNEYFLSFENLIGRLDKRYVFHRQATLGLNGFSLVKVHTNEVKYLTRWPFNEVASIRAMLNLRNDRATTLSTDFQSLVEPNVNHNIGGVKVEYVFDNTIIKGLNLRNGTRYKFFAEYYQEVDKKETDFVVLGADIRHYQKIHRDLIWANRIAGSTSFGSQRLVYYMGGVDNWILPVPSFDTSIPVAEDQNYAFQTIATPMRGFIQNARNGNSFALINSEIRFPIFKYFMNRPIKSDFVENFQLNFFGDVGAAWTGKDPYSEDNTFNIQTIQQTPLTISIKNQREPIIGGYGFGLRSRMWGYFVRADWAWGVDDGVVLPGVFYLSLSLDF